MSTPERDWRALSRLLDTALSLPAAERAAWLERLDGEHEPLKELLAREDLAENGGFLASLPKLDSIPELSVPPVGDRGNGFGLARRAQRRPDQTQGRAQTAACGTGDGRARAARRHGILLVAGDKSGGSERRFYRTLIDKADARLDSHLERLQREKGERGEPRRKK